MTDVATVELAAENLADLSLPELGRLASAEHEMGVESGLQMIRHIVRAGEALLAARNKIPAGGWLAWCDKHFISSPTTASTYMRIAFYQSEIPGGTKNLIEARDLLRGLPAITGHPGSGGYGNDIKKEAARLRRDGLTLEQVSEKLGISFSTIAKWGGKNLTARQKESQRKKELNAGRRALKEAERDRTMKAADERASEVYFALRKASKTLDQLRDERGQEPSSGSLTEAIARCHQAEAVLFKIFGSGVGSVQEGVLR